MGKYDISQSSNRISGMLEFVNDGSSGTDSEGTLISTGGCDSLVNDLTGKIALINRLDPGICQFGNSFLNAQKAGAIGAIIINSNSGPTRLFTSKYGSW